MRSSSRRQRQRQAYKRIGADAAWESTAISQLFEGQMSSMTVCMRCHHQTHSTQSFTVLSLPIPTDPIKCSIQVRLWAACALWSSVCTSSTQMGFQKSSHASSNFRFICPAPESLCSACVCAAQDCLSLFFQQTILTGGEQMLCSVCGLRRETTVFTSLDKPPEILTLHLKRSVQMYHQQSWHH